VVTASRLLVGAVPFRAHGRHGREVRELVFGDRHEIAEVTHEGRNEILVAHVPQHLKGAARAEAFVLDRVVDQAAAAETRALARQRVVVDRIVAHHEHDVPVAEHLRAFDRGVAHATLYGARRVVVLRQQRRGEG
jgi:hypothetical protein